MDIFLRAAIEEAQKGLAADGFPSAMRALLDALGVPDVQRRGALSSEKT